LHIQQIDYINRITLLLCLIKKLIIAPKGIAFEIE